jgi:hypothetical protein
MLARSIEVARKSPGVPVNGHEPLIRSGSGRGYVMFHVLSRFDGLAWAHRGSGLAGRVNVNLAAEHERLWASAPNSDTSRGVKWRRHC